MAHVWVYKAYENRLWIILNCRKITRIPECGYRTGNEICSQEIWPSLQIEVLANLFQSIEWQYRNRNGASGALHCKFLGDPRIVLQQPSSYQ